VLLVFVLLILWVTGQFVLGFGWAFWMLQLGGKHLEFVGMGHSFGGLIPWLGIVQGLWGGLYQSMMIFVRRDCPWSGSQWFRDGLIAAIPITGLWLLPLAPWWALRTTIGWLFFPLSGLLISYICAYVVNRDITWAHSQSPMM
jgi:hypothetical protein